MKPGLLQQLMLYRYRYWVGHSVLALFGVVIFTTQLSTVGPGLSDTSKASALTSATWSVLQWQEAGLHIVNLPYVLLQKLSILLFGLSTFSVRLPSALIALGSCLLFFLLMRRLHRPYVAIIASALFIAASWHIGIGRTGTPLIMIPFAWLLIIYSFVRLVRLDDPPLFWAGMAGVAGVVALYTPYGLYALLVSVLIIAVHPDIRRRVKAFNAPQLALAIIIMVPFLMPWLWGIYKNPVQLWDLFGLASVLPAPAEFMYNFGEALRALVWHAPYLPTLRLGNLPLLDIGTGALLLAGLYRTIADWRSMRSQFILCSLLLLLIITSLHPQSKHYAPLLIPIYLLAAAGVTVLFREWYKLFPRNPYARSFGLIPIIVLLGFIMAYHYQRYFIARANAPATYQAYNDDISAVRQQLARYPSLVLAVEDKDIAFYKLLISSNPQMTVIGPAGVAPAGKPLLSAVNLPRPTINPAKQTLSPVVNDDRANALRFWLVAPTNR